MVKARGHGRSETGVEGVELEIGFGYSTGSTVDMNTGWQGGVKKGVTYTATFALNDASGVVLNRRITLRGV
jgi:hypothetical protein